MDGKIRRRRQYTYNNYGSYALDPAVIAYYGTSGGGSYTGNSAQNNRFIVGGVVYQYPTPVNVMSAGSYNPQQYNSYPTAADGSYYRKWCKRILSKFLFLGLSLIANMNNMQLPSPYNGYPAFYYPGYMFPPIYNSAQPHASKSISIKLFFMIFISLMSISIL